MLELILNSWILASSASSPFDAETPRAPLLSATALRDTELVVQVRRAFSRDAELAKANIRVSVREGTAVLSGPVPDEKLVERAVEEAKKVRGVLVVKNELHVPTLKEEAPIVLPPVQPEKPTETTTAMAPREPRIESFLTTKPVGAEATHVTLGSPILTTVSRRDGPTRVVSYSISGSEAMNMATAIEKVRQLDGHYRTIQVEIRNSTLVVRGGASGEVLMDFARNLRGIEGVERVVINTNRVR